MRSVRAALLQHLFLVVNNREADFTVVMTSSKELLCVSPDAF